MLNFLFGKNGSESESNLKSSLEPSQAFEYRPAIENELHLTDLVCLRKHGKDNWLLATAKGSGDRAVHQFRFLWQIQPHHENSLSDEQMRGLVDVLGGIDKGEALDFKHLIHKDIRGGYKPADLDSLTPEVRLMQRNRAKRLRDITYQGLRKRHRYFLAKSFQIQMAESDAKGGFEKTLAMVMKLYQQKLVGEDPMTEQEKVLEMGRKAHQKLLEYDADINITAELKAELLGGNDIWQLLYEQFTVFDPELDPDEMQIPPLPYYLLIDLDRDEAIELKANGRPLREGEKLELVSYLIPEEAQPKSSPAFMDLPGRKVFCGVIGFEDIPDDYNAPYDKYTYLWSKLFGAKAKPIPADIEIHTQVTWADPVGSLKQLEDFTKQQKRDVADSKDRGDEGTLSELDMKKGQQAQKMLHTGDFPQFVATAIYVYGSSPEEVECNILFIKKRFKLPARAVQEKDIAWKIWLQSTFLRQEPLFLDSPNTMVPMPKSDYRLKPNHSAILGLSPIVGISSPTLPGTPFISEHGGVEYPLSMYDEAGNPRHRLVLGRSGSSKSATKTGILHTEQSLGIKITSVDLPDDNGHSTYGYYFAFHNGAIFDPGLERCANNILQKPDLSGLPEDTRKRREVYFTKIVNQALQTLVVDTLETSEGIPLTEVGTVLKVGSNRFYQNEKTCNALEAAIRGGIGSSAWTDYPTIQHFHDFLTIENLELDKDDPKIKIAIDHVRMRLRYWLDDPTLKRAIATPPSLDFDNNPLTLFSLGNITSEDEATIFGLSAHNCAIRRSFQSLKSLYDIDECSVFLDYKAMANNLSNGAATLRKSGVAMILTMQDPNAIEPYNKIRKNITGWMTGRINKKDDKDYERIFGIDPALLAFNKTKTLDYATQSSRWLIVDDGLPTLCRYYAPQIELGLILNSRPEAKSRELFIDAYANKFEAISFFSAWATRQMMAAKELSPHDAEIWLNGDRKFKPLAVAA